MRALLFTTLLLCTAAPAATVQVFLAAGQSNANAFWASGIESTFNALLGEGNVEVVRSEHGGAPMWMWSSGGTRGTNYQDDLAALVGRIEQIEANGDTAVFAGILWMQGESDITQPSTIPVYASRFNAMLGFYQQDLGLAEVPNFTVGVVDANVNDPYYPQISPAAVESMRNVLFGLGDLPNGSAVDSREFTRSDLWHLTPDSSTSLGTMMAQQFAATHNVPEPGVSLLILGGLFFALRRRR